MTYGDLVRTSRLKLKCPEATVLHSHVSWGRALLLSFSKVCQSLNCKHRIKVHSVSTLGVTQLLHSVKLQGWFIQNSHLNLQIHENCKFSVTAHIDPHEATTQIVLCYIVYLVLASFVSCFLSDFC